MGAETVSGLTYKLRSYVIARDRPAKMMLLGGLGAMGVGTMWSVEDKYHATDENWESAPEERCPDFSRRCVAEVFDARCWGKENHEGSHYAGYEPNKRTWT